MFQGMLDIYFERISETFLFTLWRSFQMMVLLMADLENPSRLQLKCFMDYFWFL